ncbi:MAG TPA: FAD-binding oxidoreductase [Thermomicrobiales bacterium]|nr:FAD-binding oxidoreductase [Thermomicrobiales bacterium]
MSHSRHFAELPFSVSERVTPTSTDDLSSILADASGADRTVIPLGGGISAGTGLPVEGFDIGIDTTALSGILSWEPADLVLSVRAGTTCAEVQSALAASNQVIPVDVAYPERATIGGLISTGFAGPRRLRSGSFRDLLIGCEYVRGDGLVARAGGMVVKNVSGFEIPRFLHGSWGALAVLSSVNLKITPKPRSDGTLIVATESTAEAVASALRAVSEVSTLASCVVMSVDGTTTIAARALGRDRAVSETLAEAARILGAGEVIGGDESGAWWQAYLNQFGEVDAETLIAISVRPRQAVEVVTRLRDMAGLADSASFAIDPGVGSIRVRLSGPNHELVAAIVDLVQRHGATYVLERVATELVGTIPVWGDPPDGIDLMRAIKREFDPAGILNRGRLVI